MAELSTNMTYEEQIQSDQHHDKDHIIIKNAAENNLKNISVKIPHNGMTAIIGVSGGGKSTLAHNIIHNEGNRRFLETFSPYVRQFLSRAKKPQVESAENLRASIAINRKLRLASQNTMAHFVNLQDDLANFWSYFSDASCSSCHAPITKSNLAEVVHDIIEQNLTPEHTEILVTTQVKIEEIEYKKYLVLNGYSRILTAQNELRLLTDDDIGDFSLVLTRIPAKKYDLNDILRTLETNNLSPYANIVLRNKEAFAQYILPLDNACKACGTPYTLTRPNKRLFKTNSLGGCKPCKGRGEILDFDLDKIIAKEKILGDAILPWQPDNKRYKYRKISADLDTPFCKLTQKDQQEIITLVMKDLALLDKKRYKLHVYRFLKRFKSDIPCAECDGSGLNKSSHGYRISGINFPTFLELSIEEAYKFFDNATGFQKDLASKIRHKLEILIKLGLGYIALNRKAATLSGGEAQRANIAATINHQLTNVQIILDEPTCGLHPDATRNLIKILQDLGKTNTVIIIEHDLQVIKACEYIIELGPLGGDLGGQVVYAGKAETWRGSASYLPALQEPEDRPCETKTKFTLPASPYVKIPVYSFLENRINTIVGPSGAGKSTLLELIYDELNRSENNVTLMSQDAGHRSSRSSIATLTGAWDHIRNLLAKTDEAESLGLMSKNFSLQVDSKGRCSTCSGLGYLTEDMQFLSDIQILCPECEGKKFSPATLAVTYKGKNPHEILNLTLVDASKLFKLLKVSEQLDILCDLGLGHLKLGSTTLSLSNGELQRVRLALFLFKPTPFLLLDEPTTGLHPQDIKLTFKTLREISKVSTIIAVEHNSTFILGSDHISYVDGGTIHFEGALHTFKESEFAAPYQDMSEFPKRLIQPSQGSLKIKNAHVHNLKNVNLELPLTGITSFVGVSGSGKSSIVKDIIHAESQRRFLDTVSPYARQFIKALPTPDVEINNLPPTVLINQLRNNFAEFENFKGSNVGTATYLANYLRLLFAKTAIQFCPDHPEETLTNSNDISSLIARIEEYGSSRISLLLPILENRKTKAQELLKLAYNLGIAKLRVDDEIKAIEDLLGRDLTKIKYKSLALIVASLIPSRIKNHDGYYDIFNIAKNLGVKSLIISSEAGEHRIGFAGCPICQTAYKKLNPEHFAIVSSLDCPSCASGCENCLDATQDLYVASTKLISKSDKFNSYELGRMPLAKLYDFLAGIQDESPVAKILLPELLNKISLLRTILPPEVTLNRTLASLSSGEQQKVKIARALSLDLTDTIYILDEPSANLHPQDLESILAHIKSLRHKNGVYLIEHDPTSILLGDNVCEIGPGGGRDGGNLVFFGSKDKFLASNTITATHLSQKCELRIIDAEESGNSEKRNTFKFSLNSQINNLKPLSLTLPQQGIVTIAGVAGAGKSSLFNQLAQIEAESHKCSTAYIEFSLDTPFQGKKIVDKTTIGSSRRSVVASYLGIFDYFRDLLAKTLSAQKLGMKKGDFSFNSGKFKCQKCGGAGSLIIADAIPPIPPVTCDACDGGRYDLSEIADVKYQGLNIRDMLQLTISDAATLFSYHKKINSALSLGTELGLGYLSLGQQTDTLSGGERQRIKLLDALKSRQERLLFMLDEPTVGLHIADTIALFRAMRNIVKERKALFITVEHDEVALRMSDYIIELGPKGGQEGGELIACGSIQDLCANPKSVWGQRLKDIC